jgi:hypothetical protein
VSTLQQDAKSLYVEYLTGKTGVVGALNTRLDPHRLTRDQLAASQNLWVTPLGVLVSKPGISTAFATGTMNSTSVALSLPFKGSFPLRFGAITYVLVQDSQGNVFVFPKYSGNTQWFYVTSMTVTAGGNYITSNIAQLFDPVTNVTTAFLCNVGTQPLSYTGSIGKMTAGLTGGGGSQTVTPTSFGGGMLGVYNGQLMNLGEGTANFETGVAVSSVTATNFKVSPTKNHSAGDYFSAGATAVGTVPNNFTNSGAIQPKYVETLFSNLFYSGEVSAPTAVYVSDPYYPESFTSNFFQSTIYPGSYQPALIGFNDGVAGGDVTGLRRLGTQMMVYKQSALYSLSLVSLYGDMVWQVQIVSPTIGCVAPNSIVSFDTFHVFLAIDGVYITDGTMVRRIDFNIPTFFDQSGTGSGASLVITDYTGTVAARYGSVYLIYFDAASAGYATTGLWLDFEQTDSQGYPLAGQFAFNASVGGIGGIASMRGPSDTGTPFIISSQNNLVGEFDRPGVLTPGDFGFAISKSMTLKADMFEDLMSAGMFYNKTLERIAVIGESLSSNAVTLTVAVNNGNPSVIGGANFQSNVGANFPNVGVVQVKEGVLNGGSWQQVSQISISENSIYPWVIYGVLAEMTPGDLVLN